MGNQQLCRICEKIETNQISKEIPIQKRQVFSIVNALNKSNNKQNKKEMPDFVKQFIGKGKVQYQPGWVYEGDLVKGIRHGLGKMTWPSGDFYKGNFYQGRAQGEGVFQMVTGIRYQGQFQNDQIIKGIRVSADGKQIYKGFFKDHNFEGFGILKQEDEFEYRGMFRKNKMEGDGQIYYADGSSFKGKFKGNKKHGSGVYSYTQGTNYQGYWYEGECREQQTLIDII